MKKVLCHIIFLILAIECSFGQTTFVPDANLRKFLADKYATYLDANQYVLDTKASSFVGTIECSNLGIKDLTGLWKFTGLTALKCSSNAISNLDSIVKLKNLSLLYCFKNNIASLPDLTPLTKLSYISCGTNQLTSLPDLSTHTPLTYLDCSVNKISEIKGLGTLSNLQFLLLFNNRFDTLPNLAPLSKLQVLMCHENNLRRLSGLDKLTQLTSLIAGRNSIDSLPDLSGLSKLAILMVYNCQLSKMPNVGNMRNLNQLVLAGNKITLVSSLSGNPTLSILDISDNLISKLPDISACKASLNTLKLNGNKLDSLPSLSLFTTLDTVHVHNNLLTFEDIIPLASISRITNLKYAPQDSVGKSKELIVTERQPFSLVLGIDKKVTSNKYTWYKNGQPFTVTSTDTLYIPVVQQGDSGTYTCQVQNTLAPALALMSRTTKLIIKPCIDLSRLAYAITDFDCNIGGSLHVDGASIKGGQPPYSYKLEGNKLSSVRYPNGNAFTNLFETSYILEVKDQLGCKAFSGTIQLKGKSATDCESLVILGDNNSANNNLLLEEKGTAYVYDKEGQLVQLFTTPSLWDGRNNKGEFLPGFYVIDLNGKRIQVTLIK